MATKKLSPQHPSTSIHIHQHPPHSTKSTICRPHSTTTQINSSLTPAEHPWLWRCSTDPPVVATDPAKEIWLTTSWSRIQNSQQLRHCSQCSQVVSASMLPLGDSEKRKVSTWEDHDDHGSAWQANDPMGIRMYGSKMGQFMADWPNNKAGLKHRKDMNRLGFTVFNANLELSQL